jgi:uncharacterized peroxidase-related enzyme
MSVSLDVNTPPNRRFIRLVRQHRSATAPPIKLLLLWIIARIRGMTEAIQRSFDTYRTFHCLTVSREFSAPMAFRPETASPLHELADVLLRRPGTLMPGERGLIATYISSQNDCFFCQTIHGAVAAHHLNGDEQLVIDVKRNPSGAKVSDKLKALLAIAGKVQRGGKNVTVEDIERAREHGAPDLELHDTVLIAAACCMYNRYVDGLATWAPTDQRVYRESGARLAGEGYQASTADWQPRNRSFQHGSHQISRRIARHPRTFRVSPGNGEADVGTR